MQDFDQVYLKNYKEMLRFVRASIWDVENAQEVVQELFLVAYRKWDDIKFRDDLGVKRWLVQAASLCIKEWRRKNVPYLTTEISVGEERDVFMTQSGSFEMTLGLEELYTSAMSTEERTALTEHYQEGRTAADIARRYGVTEDAMKKRMERGRKHLKRELDTGGKIL